jgi:hypothetical protein
MTPSEVAKLRFAPLTERRAVFAALKRAKLDTRVAPPVAPARTQLPQARQNRKRPPPRSQAASAPTTRSADDGWAWWTRERAEQIAQFRKEHRDTEAALSDKAIAGVIAQREREEEQADADLAERLESFRRPKPAPLPN